MTDFRAICARMADELDHYRQLLMDDRRETHSLADEARAALAQPEPQGPTDEELEAFAEPFMEVIDDGFTGVIHNEVAYARAVLARWGRSKPPSLKEQSLAMIDLIQSNKKMWDLKDLDVVRKALEQLND